MLFHLLCYLLPVLCGNTRREKILRETYQVAELTLHERAKECLCQPGQVFPARVSSFLITEGNKIMVKRCLQFTIIQHKKQEESINSITVVLFR